MDEGKTIQLDIKTEININEKCADVIRDNSSGVYSFQCFHCGKLLLADLNDCIDIFKHLDAHYTFEQEEAALDEGKYFSTNFLKIDVPNYDTAENDTDNNVIIIENTSTSCKKEEEQNYADPMGNSEVSDLYQCKICEQKFVRNFAYRKHCRMHEVGVSTTSKTTQSAVGSKYCCTVCSSSYPSRKELNEHHKLCLKLEIPDYKCQTCGKSFSKLYKFKAHLLTHLDAKLRYKFDCDICGARYAYKSHLNTHMRKHCSYDQINEVNKSIDDNAQIKIKTTTQKQCDKKDETKTGQNAEQEKSSAAEEVCDICNRVYKYRKTLDDHKRLKHPEQYYQTKLLYCEFCSKTFFQNLNLVLHRNSCVKNTTRIRSNDEQTNIAINETKIVCKFCGNAYKFKRSLNSHLRQVHPEQITSTLWKCKYCGKAFVQEHNLHRHVSEHERGQQQIQYCNKCNKVFKYKSNLLKHHRKFHPTSINYICEYCNKGFTKRSALLTHMTMHCDIRPFRCHNCGKQFKSVANLKCHKLSHDPVEKRKHVCLVCGKAFSLRGNLNIHLRIHSGEKPYECSFCGQRFVQQFEMKVHVRRIHTGEAPHQCEICGRRFFEGYRLTEHMRRHNQDKRFQCEYCTERFYNRHLKKLHERKHTGLKPISCDQCDRKFRTPNTLLQHKVIHTGLKAYSCKFCDMKFAQGSGRRSHEKLVHGAV